MGKLNNLQNIGEFTLKCVLSKTSNFAEVFEGELIWEETKLTLRYLLTNRNNYDGNEEIFFGVGSNGEKFTILKTVMQHRQFNSNGIEVITYLVTEYIASSIYNLDKYDFN
ncbi:hypothetical protein [Lysinibacillus sp. ZYM-1]|uniref:hypothetical protein n=1 Tax=Lysinibacillus sp. ZYM-1 TaxID=1681184 RepID=UPI0006CEA16D|nr:hypothetical protein [Lysinibacillus sp. ZYM-1]KPN95436.1 hypothetical protein AO843_20595 [Lysinibacillus sp. ZYM-1]